MRNSEPNYLTSGLGGRAEAKASTETKANTSWLGRQALPVGLALSLAGAVLAAGDAKAASYATRALGCKGNVCLNASFKDSTLKISSSYNGGPTITHCNYRSDCFCDQRDVDRGKVMSVGVPGGCQSCSVSAQWCSRGGIGFRSVCGDWQTWDVPTPQDNLKVVTKCADGIC